MNQQLFHFILYCELKRRETKDSKQFYHLACLDALRYALIMSDATTSESIKPAELIQNNKLINPIIRLTKENFNRLYNELKGERPATALNWHFKTRFEYQEDYSPSKEEFQSILSEIRVSLPKRLAIAAELDAFAIEINYCSDFGLKLISTQVYREGQESLKCSEGYFKSLDSDYINKVLREATNRLIDHRKKRVALDKTMTAIAVIGGILSLAIAIPLIILSISNPLTLGIGIGVLVGGTGIEGFGLYKAVELFKRIDPPEFKANLLELEPEDNENDSPKPF